MKKLLLLTALLAQPIYATWDITTPAGTEAKSLGDNRIREFKTDVQTALQHEGDFPGEDTSSPRFIWTPSTGTTSLRPSGSTNTAVGMLYINVSSRCIEQLMSGTTNWECIDTVSTGAITNAKLSTNSVTSTTIQDATIALVDMGAGSVGTDAIVDGSVNASDIGTSIVGPGLDGANGRALAVQIDSVTIQNTANRLNVNSTINLSSVNVSGWLGFKSFTVLPLYQALQFTTTSSSATTHANFGLTNLTLSITPRKATNKVMIFASFMSTQTAGGTGYFTIINDGSNLAGANGLQSVTAGTTSPVMLIFYDTPGQDTPTTYTVGFRTTGGTLTAQHDTTTGVMILVEFDN